MPPRESRQPRLKSMGNLLEKTSARLAACALSGLMLVACFPKFHLPGLVWVACLPLLVGLGG